MPRFNFNEITKSGKADIDLIGQNFQEIEENGITYNEVSQKVGQDNFKFIERSDATSGYSTELYIIRRGKIVIIHGYINVKADGHSGTVYLISDDDFEDWFMPSKNYTSTEFISLGGISLDARYANASTLQNPSYALPYIRLIPNDSGQEVRFQMDIHLTGEASYSNSCRFSINGVYAVD